VHSEASLRQDYGEARIRKDDKQSETMILGIIYQTKVVRPEASLRQDYGEARIRRDEISMLGILFINDVLNLLQIDIYLVWTMGFSRLPG